MEKNTKKFKRKNYNCGTKNLKGGRGITLIALIITIIVLLILAGVTIVALSGENGILQRATEAKEKTQNANIEEQRQLTIMEAIINTEETTYKNVTIPAGMAVSQVEGENTLEKGLVAIDKNGNEWVWIEVPKSIYTKTEYNGGTGPSFDKPITDEDYQKIKDVLIAYAGVYRKGSATQNLSWTDEWYSGCGIVDSGTYTTMYQKMLSSVYTNGGFWIGRYEAGVSNTTPRTASGEITGLEAKSQKNMYPFNYVTCSQAQTLANAMSTDRSKTSSLMFGIQWDLVCKYLEGKDGLTTEKINSDSYIWGNYANSQIKNLSGKYAICSQTEPYPLGEWNTIPEGYSKPSSGTENWVLLSTGASEYTKKMNIYDFAGNEWEWTLEHATSSTDFPCAVRGGRYGYDGSDRPASYRHHDSTSYSYNKFSFRPSLY